ncbi:WYL domain-containing protein [Planctomonas sp. JC2975]|uniref:helix-turn-helix transcriptional regulator n=1 Tax=Planctomonas sp. JC2975 TaxID=2729626 RepID=UPI003211E320
MADTATPRDARDKLALLLSLIPYLMDNESVPVADAAAAFDVSPKQIRDAVHLIAVSGLPGESHAYLPGDLFDIDWDELEEHDRIALTHTVAIDDTPRLSAREAAALIAGLQYLSSLPEHADRDAMASLMAKLERGTATGAAQVAVAPAALRDTVATVREAIERRTQLDFDYVSARGDSERRTVDPLRVESVNDDWYLRGWCHLRKAVRTFRIDRIDHLVSTGKPISEHAAGVVLPERMFQGSAEDLTVSVDVAAPSLPLIADYIPEDAERVHEGDLVHTKVRVAHYHGLKRLVARFAGQVVVTAPDDARAAVAEWVRAGAERYEEAGQASAAESAGKGPDA